MVAGNPGQGEDPGLRSLLPLTDHHLVPLPQYHARSLLFPAANTGIVGREDKKWSKKSILVKIRGHISCLLL